MKSAILFISAITFNIFIQAQISPPEIDYLTVNPATQKIEIRWSHPDLNSINGYYIKRKIHDFPGVIPGSIITIAAINNENTFFYTDNSLDYGEANPQNIAEEYYISAFRENDTELIISPLSKAHAIILPSGTYDYCSKKITLNWTRYKGWENNLKSYTVFSGKNPESLQVIYTGIDTFFTTEKLSPNQTYYFTVQAKRQDNIVSKSALISIFTEQPDLPDKIHISKITDKETYLDFDFKCDYTDSANKTALFQSDTKISEFKKIATDSNNTNFSVPDNSKISYYCIALYDYCDDIIMYSDTLSNLILSVNQDNENIELNWNQQKGEESQLFEIINNIETEIFTSNTESNYSCALLPFFNEQFDSGNQISKICYRVEQKNPSKNYTKISRKVCTAPEAIIRCPNAISLSSNNEDDRNFKVFVAFTTSYELNIYDKFGRLIFTANKPSETWNGKDLSGNSVPFSSYIYIINYTDYKGIETKLKGNITLLP